MIKVLLAGPSLNESVGGIAVHIKNLLDIFDGSEDVIIDHFAITEAKYNQESWPRKIQRFISILLPFTRRLRSCSVLHLNSTFDNRSIFRDFFFALLAIILNFPKIIIQFHGGEPSNVIFFRIKALRFLCALLLKRVACILILSKYQQIQFDRYFQDTSVKLMPNCVTAVTQKEKAIDQKKIIFLFIGRISESKGVIRIIEATRILAAEGHGFRVNICGTGPLQARLKYEITRNELSKYVQYHGFVNGDLKERILRQSDVMLLPTNHNEGFPYALLEAFNYAMPVIGTRKGAIPEVIEEGVDGFIIDSEDYLALYEKMNYFCTHPDRVVEMGKNGREKLSLNYDCKLIQAELVNLYGG